MSAPDDAVSAPLSAPPRPQARGRARSVHDDGPFLSEERLARKFTERHGEDVEYVPAWGCWMIWNGACWYRDDTLDVIGWIRDICREATLDLLPDWLPRQLRHAAARVRTVEAVERLARTHGFMADGPEDWDTHPSLVASDGGTIELETGDVRPNDRDDYLTRAAAAVAGGECPSWHAFLARVTGGDAAFASYLQRLSGYCLGGYANEQKLFLLWGPGANGKSVFLNTISAVMGGLAATVPVEHFLAGERRGLGELEALATARLLAAYEVEPGRQWSETRIKALTGGDPVPVKPGSEGASFVPQFKIIVAANHQPGLAGVDPAIRRRIELIPFREAIAPEERDIWLGQKLKAEWGGILAWMVAGYRKWRTEGLDPPTVVTEATSRYLEEEDGVGLWFEACCRRDAASRASYAELFESWSKWAKANGRPVGTTRLLNAALDARAFSRGKFGKDGTRGFGGIAIVSYDQDKDKQS